MWIQLCIPKKGQKSAMFSNLPGFQIHYPCIILELLPSDPWPPPALWGVPMLASKKPTHHPSLCVNSVINLQTAWNCHVMLSGKFPNSIIFQGGFTALKSLVDLSAVSTCATIGMSICAAWQNSSGIFASVVKPDRSKARPKMAPKVPIWCCASVFHKCIYHICRTHSEYKRNHKAYDVSSFCHPWIHSHQPPSPFPFKAQNIASQENAPESLTHHKIPSFRKVQFWDSGTQNSHLRKSRGGLDWPLKTNGVCRGVENTQQSLRIPAFPHCILS